jgi:SAM-dependent methyltransferase
MATEPDRGKARQIAREHLERGDPLGWFEALYATAEGDPRIIPWADMAPNPNLVQWLDSKRIAATGKKALKVGCGLGDDAEELAHRGFDVVAFDISATAIAWCRRRFPESCVTHIVMDLFDAPKSWFRAFDFVLESYTLQVLPPELRTDAMRRICGFVAPGGTLLVISRGRNSDEDRGNMPWPLTRDELAKFQRGGLQEISFEDYLDNENPPVRRFRAQYRASDMRQPERNEKHSS